MKCNFHSPLVVLAEGAASGESPSQGITGFCEFNLRTLSSKESIASSMYSDYCGNSKMPVCKIPVEGFRGRATVSGKSIWALAECFWRGAWLGSIRIPAHKCLGALGRTLSQTTDNSLCSIFYNLDISVCTPGFRGLLPNTGAQP